MTFNALFDILDLNQDGRLSRSELHRAAQRLGWHWPEAPVFAVLDLLTILKPISKDTFLAYMNQIEADPLGPYGEVLLNAPLFSALTSSEDDSIWKPIWEKAHRPLKNRPEAASGDRFLDDGVSLLKQAADRDSANNYLRLLNSLDSDRISMEHTALLIIDPQRSFTRGAWMQSIGSRAQAEVKPIQLAFNNCARFLNENRGRLETMFSRCPFPPDSYPWDDRLAGVIGSTQLYFIKPGNSILFPATNGFRQWVRRCLDAGKNTLMMGGCTLNSCVRVSSIETHRRFKDQGLQVVVDLSLSGARVSNYLGSPAYGGLSSVESAVLEMTAAGVRVVRRSEWNSLD